MKNVYIVGAGDFGREMESLLEMLPEFKTEFIIKGFLDISPLALEGKKSDYEILGSYETYVFESNDYALIAISNIELRKKIVELLFGRVEFFTYVAPSANVGKYTTIGLGSIIGANCFVSSNTTIHDFVIINVGSNVGHDCTIGPYCSLMASVDVGGSVNLGEGAWLGTKTTIIPATNIIENVTVGAGSVVIKSLKEPGSYFGIPAKYIGRY